MIITYKPKQIYMHKERKRHNMQFTVYLVLILLGDM